VTGGKFPPSTDVHYKSFLILPTSSRLLPTVFKYFAFVRHRPLTAARLGPRKSVLDCRKSRTQRPALSERIFRLQGS